MVGVLNPSILHARTHVRTGETSVRPSGNVQYSANLRWQLNDNGRALRAETLANSLVAKDLRTRRSAKFSKNKIAALAVRRQPSAVASEAVWLWAVDAGLAAVLHR
jgi:hypothetical protein